MYFFVTYHNIAEYVWVILLNLVHTRNLQFLAIPYNSAANEHRFLLKTIVKYQ